MDLLYFVYPLINRNLGYFSFLAIKKRPFQKQITETSLGGPVARTLLSQCWGPGQGNGSHLLQLSLHAGTKVWRSQINNTFFFLREKTRANGRRTVKLQYLR